MSAKVKLRQKKLKGNKVSLYLDFWPPVPHPATGEPTRREFLGKYIYIPIGYRKKRTKAGDIKIPVYSNSKIEDEDLRIHNENELRAAEEIKRQWENKLNKLDIYTPFEKELYEKIQRGKEDFVKYFTDLADKRTGLNHDNWIAASKYLKKYTGGVRRFADINEKFCNDFKDYLLSANSIKSPGLLLSNNSAVSYFRKFKAALNQAGIDGYISPELNRKIKPIKEKESRKNFLTHEELKILAKTECRNPLLKKAALFSALTGLRFSDIQKLTWGEIQHNKAEGYFISYVQKKTEEPGFLNISDQAFKLLGPRGKSSDQIFEGLNYSAYSNRHLYQWIAAAGIDRDITFHSFRHTYATLQLSLGTDIYTLSNMLGHKSLKTTEVYAHIISATKREAANRIVLDIDL